MKRVCYSFFQDVVPFVPVQNATMADCVDIAREFADRLAMELNVPVYLYGEAQEKNYRRELSQIREGEYEALYSKVRYRKLSLKEILLFIYYLKIRKSEWKPDYGKKFSILIMLK